MRAILIGVFLGLALLPAPIRADGLTGDIDGLVKEAMRTWHVPGVAVAIVRNREVIYLKGHGVRAVGETSPVTPDTLFPIASCTKAFTTAALAILVDEGKLDWDDPVRKHVAFFHLSDPMADRDVRIRDLLCHRTGLRNHDLLWYRSPWSQEEEIRRAGLLPLDKPFRTTFQYQSTMFLAAGFAVRSASGMSWEDFVQTRLLTPLEMKGTVFTSTAAAKSPDHATGHFLNDNDMAEPLAPYLMETPYAAGSIHSSARDLASWLRFQLNKGAVGEKQIVSATSLGETQRPQMVIRLEGSDRATHPDTIQMSYGMGWVIQDYRGKRLVSHAGIIDGFRCHLTMVPDEKIGIVLLANLHRTRLNQALSNALVDRLVGLPAKDWNGQLMAVARQEAADAEAAERVREAAHRPGTRPSLAIDDYAGTYEHPAYGPIHVTVDHGQLVWTLHSFHAPLVRFENDAFLLPIDLLSRPIVRFVIKADGIESMKVGGNVNAEFRRVQKPSR